jgi:hypothetical protein
MATDGMSHGGMPMQTMPMQAPMETVTPTPADGSMPLEPATGPQLDGVLPSGASPPDPAANHMMPQWQRTATAPAGQVTRSVLTGPTTSTPGLIGPIGYDVQK